MIDWFKKHRVLFALICVVILLLLMGIPFVINILFKINTTTDIFVAEWSAGDALELLWCNPLLSWHCGLRRFSLVSEPHYQNRGR